MKKKPAISFVYDREHKVDRGEASDAPIQCRVSEAGMSYFKNTIYRLRPQDWNEAERMPFRSNEHLKKIYAYLLDFEDVVRDNYKAMMRRGMTLNKFNCGMLWVKQARPTAGGDFLMWWENQLKQVKHPGTKRSQQQTLNKLKAFTDVLPFERVDVKFLEDFIKHLEDEGLHVNTIEGHLRRVRRYINKAINHDKMTENPFRRLDKKPKKIPTDREALTIEEIRAIEKLKYPEGSTLQKIKDVFLLLLYTGMRYGEAMAITEDNIRRSSDGLLIHLPGDFRKYPKPVDIPIWLLFDGKGQEIVLKYFDGDSFSMPQYENQPLNRYLKTLQHDAEIQKPLHCHIARHSFATIIAAKYPDVFLLKDLMGWVDFRTAQNYVKGSTAITISKLKKIDNWD